MKEEQNNDVKAPDISDEEMKMPENVANPNKDRNAAAPLSGALIIILVLLLVFILGGLYLWFNKLMMEQSAVTPTVPAVERPTAAENNEPESTTAEAAVEAQQAFSTSDELTAIEADIEGTDLDSLEAELNAIDAELEAALGEGS